MEDGQPVPPEATGLPAGVQTRILAELGERGTKVIDCLRTAAALITLARDDGVGLRLAESAAYNLREALDAVVHRRRAPEGGVGTVVKAWRRYRMVIRTPEADMELARSELDQVLARLEQDEERQGSQTRKLLEYVRDQTGVEPLPGESDLTVQYARLRERANQTLHAEGTLAGVATLYDDAVAWFIRFFTPPDDRVRAVGLLAEEPYTAGRIEELQHLVLNAHHLGLFFSRLQDPGWLRPLQDAGLIPLPTPGVPWPVTFLVGRAGAIGSRPVAVVLDRLLTEARQEPKPRRLDIARDILQSASRLGAAGHHVARKVIGRYPRDHWVQVMATSISEEADPTDPIQFPIADAVLGHQATADHGYYSRKVLARLAEGLTVANAAGRFGLLAAKIRKLAGGKEMRLVVLDVAALHADVDDLREPVIILAQSLTRMIPIVRELGLATAALLRIVETIPGELGQRIICQVLTGADDVNRVLKISHVVQRFTSDTVTGDDCDLMADVLTGGLGLDELDRLRTAFGRPVPPGPDDQRDPLPDDWVRAWRWSLVLPEEVLEGWSEAIEAVDAQYGSPAALDTRIPSFMSGTVQSPHRADELAALPVFEAAALVGAWRPSQDDNWQVSALELARSLEAVVQENPAEWTEDVPRVVSLLREPVHIDHYFRAVRHKASELNARIETIMAAVKLVRSERWEPAPIGRNKFQYESTWAVVDTVTVEMIGAFANEDADLADHLDLCWQLASDLDHAVPDDPPLNTAVEGTSGFDDPLNRAIGRPYGMGLEGVLALAGWEHRNQGQASRRLVEILDDVLALPGAVGLELRSILARSRIFLEAIAHTWLDARADELFGRSPLGKITFDQTLKWAPPSKWLFGRYQARLYDAAGRGAEHAVPLLLVAYLWEEPGYTFASIIGHLAGHVEALRVIAEEMAALVQNIDASDPLLDRGRQFWVELLDAERAVVPAAALTGAGRWTHVKALTDEQWLELMDRTLGLTGGEIDMASEIAGRCKDAQPSGPALRMLRMMIGHGEPWEQHHIETIAVEALRAAAEHPFDEEFDLLRTRLIERGRHEVVDLG